MKKKILFFNLIIAISLLFSAVYATIEDVIGEVNVNPVEKELAGDILGALQWIGYAIAVGMIIYIGIKYTMSAADDRAELKGAAVKYVMGALLIMVADTIVTMVFNAFYSK